MITKLANFKTGDSGVIVDIEQGPNAYYRQRLLSMGLIPGTKFKLKKISPLGDPIELVLRECSICLRQAEATILIVKRYFI